ncbi:MAG: hypothetical protein WDW38_005500 [Sanguina aurantia]
MNFQTSTHKSRWLYTKDALGEMMWWWLWVSFLVGKHWVSYDSPITLEEQSTLLRFFMDQIRELCVTKLGLPKKVQAAAQLYFQRYYLRQSVLDSPLEPKRVMLTCIYVAAKIEESYISAEGLAAKVGQEPSIILRSEVAVLQGLGFDLITHSPLRALAGLIQDPPGKRRRGSDAGCTMCRTCATLYEPHLGRQAVRATTPGLRRRWIPQQRRRARDCGPEGRVDITNLRQQHHHHQASPASANIDDTHPTTHADPATATQPPPASSSAEAGSAEPGSSAVEGQLDDAILRASEAEVAAAHAKAAGAVEALLLSDAPLTHPPAQLALAALRSGWRGKGVRLQAYLVRAARQALQANAQSVSAAPGSDKPTLTFGPVELDTAAGLLAVALDDIDMLGMAGAVRVEVSQVQDIDKRIKAWKKAFADRAGGEGAANGDVQKAEKRDAKVKARRDQAAAEEAELLGMPQQQPAASAAGSAGQGSHSGATAHGMVAV